MGLLLGHQRHTNANHQQRQQIQELLPHSPHLSQNIFTVSGKRICSVSTVLQP
jgi:hypothetical protein